MLRTTVIPVPRDQWVLYTGHLTEFYGCLTKQIYLARLPATKQAYALESIRRGRLYNVYTCKFCGWYHIGRQPKQGINYAQGPKITF